MNLPSALVYSTRLRVSVCGTGINYGLSLADFLGSMLTFAIALSEDAAYCRLSALRVDLPALVDAYDL